MSPDPETTTQQDGRLRACHCCGLLQRLPHVPEGHRALCERCHTTIWVPRRRHRSNAWAASAAWTALVLYLPAIVMPVMEIERLGHLRRSSIWEGSLALMGEGELVVGGIVFLCSVVIPLLKIAGLIAITHELQLLNHRQRALTYRLIEAVGRWGMVDVLLVSLLVAFLKLGDLVEVSPGPGVFVFAGMVVASLLAGALFDPHSLWKEGHTWTPKTTRS